MVLTLPFPSCGRHVGACAIGGDAEQVLSTSALHDSFFLVGEGCRHCECFTFEPRSVDWEVVVILHLNIDGLTAMVMIHHGTKRVVEHRRSLWQGCEQTRWHDEIGPDESGLVKVGTNLAGIDQGVGTKERLEKWQGPLEVGLEILLVDGHVEKEQHRV